MLIAVESLVWTEKVQIHHPAWLFITLFLLLGLFAGIRIYYGSILMQTLESSVSLQVAARIFNDNSVLQKQVDNILYIFYFFSAALLLYVIEIRLGLEPYALTGGHLYLFNLGLLIAVFLVRVVLVIGTGFIFNKISIYREYLYNTFIFNKLIGVFILPLLLFVIYTDGILMIIFQWIALVAVFALLMMRLIRSVVFSFRRGVSIFYMFLYLCALEMAPLILLYRWLEGIL
ncbi:MAG: DUF4271 domain-containing protein [Bacteroides sp.]|nr:DUF4271 domain-containing protein [Bacteroides sp.]